MSWLVIAGAIAARVGAVVVGWRLLVWLVRGRNPWREPPRWPRWWRVDEDQEGGRRGN